MLAFEHVFFFSSGNDGIDSEKEYIQMKIVFRNNHKAIWNDNELGIPKHAVVALLHRET